MLVAETAKTIWMKEGILNAKNEICKDRPDKFSRGQKWRTQLQQHLSQKTSLITTTNPYNGKDITSHLDTITKTLLFDSLLSFFEEFGGTSHLPHLGLPSGKIPRNQCPIAKVSELSIVFCW